MWGFEIEDMVEIVRLARRVGVSQTKVLHKADQLISS